MRWGPNWIGALALVVGCALCVPAAAFAAPPNDDFAEREDLGTGLPVEVERTNLGATSEAGEPSVGGSGHSVWFKWKATATELVTVGTCNGGIGFRAEIGVFTGAALGALTEIAGWNAGGRADCPGEWGTTATFRAVAGVEYAIAVDGLPSFPDPESGQGFIALKIAATPTPANDAFSAAAPLSDTSPPSGVYSVGAQGFTWNATKEPGEPAHGGDLGGASVWYSWTAPSTDRYGVAVSCPKAQLVYGVYTGTSVGGLTNLTGKGECGMLLLDASAGTTYRIAIDGKGNGDPASVTMGSFSVGVFRSPSSPAPREFGSFPEIDRPFRPKPINTMLRRRVVVSEQRRATFYFRSNQKEARFRCQLDRRMPTWCKSPKTYKHLSVGRHEFKVIAIDPTSHGDGTPPIARFRIAKSARSK